MYYMDAFQQNSQFSPATSHMNAVIYERVYFILEKGVQSFCFCNILS